MEKFFKLFTQNLFLIFQFIYDGWSSGILAKELSVIYEAFCQMKPSPLAELPIQYADFSLWQWQSLQDNSWQSQIDFWKKHIGINPPILKRPTDYPRTTAQPVEIALHTFLISQDLTDALKALSHQEIVTAPHKPISDLCPLSEPERFSLNTSPLSSSINNIKSKEFIKPRNLTEETMVNIWKEVLELEQINIDDNFFEIGGNSRKFLRIIDKISKNLQINCPLRDFFENPTIASLVDTLDQESFKDL